MRPNGPLFRILEPSKPHFSFLSNTWGVCGSGGSSLTLKVRLHMNLDEQTHEQIRFRKMWSSWISQLSIANLQSLIPGPPLWKWKYQSRCMPVSSLAVIPVSFIPWILSLRHGPSTNKQQMLKCLLWLTLDLHHRLPFSSKVLNSKQRVMQVWLILWEELQLDHGRTDVCLSVRKKPVCYIVIMTNILRAKSGMNFLKSPCFMCDVSV